MDIDMTRDIDMTGNGLEDHFASLSRPPSTATRAPKPADLGRYDNGEFDKNPEAAELRVGVGDNAISDPTAAITDLGSWTAKLADLNVRMSQHVQSFPEVMHGDNDTGQVLSAEEGGAMFCIDKTLHLSQEFC